MARDGVGFIGGFELTVGVEISLLKKYRKLTVRVCPELRVDSISLEVDSNCL